MGRVVFAPPRCQFVEDTRGGDARIGFGNMLRGEHVPKANGAAAFEF